MRTDQRPGGPSPKNRKPGIDTDHRQRKPSDPPAGSPEQARAEESNREASHSTKPVTNQDEQRKVTNSGDSEEEIEGDARPYHRHPAADFVVTRKAPR